MIDQARNPAGNKAISWFWKDDPRLGRHGACGIQDGVVEPSAINAAKVQAPVHLQPGSHYASFVPLLQLVVYGVILDEDAYEKMAYGLPWGGRRPVFAADLFRPREELHAVRVFSAMRPNGEIGRVPASKLHIGLSREAFGRARAQGWPADFNSFRSVVLGPPGEVDARDSGGPRDV